MVHYGFSGTKCPALYGSDIALVEINPSEERDAAVTWSDYSLIESARPDAPYRREMS